MNVQGLEEPGDSDLLRNAEIFKRKGLGKIDLSGDAEKSAWRGGEIFRKEVKTGNV